MSFKLSEECGFFGLLGQLKALEFRVAFERFAC